MNEANQDIKQVDKHCTAEEFLIDDDNRPQTQMVRKAYDEMDCMFGTYFPYHMSLITKWGVRFAVTCLVAVFYWAFITAMLSTESINASIGLSLAMVALFAFWVYICFFVLSKKYYVYFFKHNGKLYTIHYHKLRRYLAIRLDVHGYYRYYFTTKTWKESDDSTMGPYLMFPRFNLTTQFNRDEQSSNIRKGLFNRTIIKNVSYLRGWRADTISYFIFKNEQLKKIEYIKILLGRNSEDIVEKLKFIETNKIHCINVPKSLVYFCKECGLEAPEESEHIHYVDMN